MSNESEKQNNNIIKSKILHKTKKKKKKKSVLNIFQINHFGFLFWKRVSMLFTGIQVEPNTILA